jgi:hypothetical protein
MDINKQTIRCRGAGQANLNSIPPRAMDKASYPLGDKTFFLDFVKPDLAELYSFQFTSSSIPTGQ